MAWRASVRGPATTMRTTPGAEPGERASTLWNASTKRGTNCAGPVACPAAETTPPNVGRERGESRRADDRGRQAAEGRAARPRLQDPGAVRPPPQCGAEGL